MYYQNFHNHRDSLGRFAPKPPKYPKLDLNGNYRDKNGKFAAKPAWASTPKPSKATSAKPKGPTTSINSKLVANKAEVTLSVNDILSAIEKNGVKQTRGWGRYVGSTLIAGCAIAQGAYNLGLHEQNVYHALNNVYGNNQSALGSEIIRLNDKEKMTLPQIVAQIRAKYADKLETKVVVRAVS